MVVASVVMAEDIAEPDTIEEAAADSRLASAVLRMELTALVPIALSVPAELDNTTADDATPGAEAAETTEAAEAGEAVPAAAVAGAWTCPSSIWLTSARLARTVALALLECLPPSV